MNMFKLAVAALAGASSAAAVSFVHDAPNATGHAYTVTALESGNFTVQTVDMAPVESGDDWEVCLDACARFCFPSCLPTTISITHETLT